MWPERFTSAACLSFDFDAEEVWIGEDAKNATKPGVLSQGTYGAKVAVPELLTLLEGHGVREPFFTFSQGTYGAKVAVPELLALLERHGVRATFFVPGRVAERYPARVEQIVAAGHAVAHHARSASR